MLTFSAFFAASAPDRLSKVTNPTGCKVKKKEGQSFNFRGISSHFHFNDIENIHAEGETTVSVQLAIEMQFILFKNNWWQSVRQPAACLVFEYSITAAACTDGRRLTCFDVNLISDPS